MKLSRLLKSSLTHWMAILYLLYGNTASGEDREIRIRPHNPQFGFVAVNDDPYIMLMERHGGLKERPAEFTVFEIVEKGRRLRKLSATVGRNPNIPLGVNSMGRGRFLVTFDEWEGKGITDNCLVIYDFARKTTVAMRLEDFVPADVRAKLMGAVYMSGFTWQGNPVVDYQNLIIYASSPADCKDLGVPFVVIDVRSQTAEVRPAPAALPPTAGKLEERLQPPFWDWSMGGQPEPGILTKFAYPTYLKMSFRKEAMSKEFRDSIEFEESACYELDPASGDYIRCALEKWIRRPDANKLPTDKK